MTIGERVKYVRLNVKNGGKMTLEEFGQKIGIAGASLSLIENGKNGISDRTVLAICREYHVNEIWLRTGEGEPFASMTMEEELTELFADMLDQDDVIKKEVIKMLLKLPPDAWQVIRDEINGLIETQKERPGR